MNSKGMVSLVKCKLNVTSRWRRDQILFVLFIIILQCLLEEQAMLRMSCVHNVQSDNTKVDRLFQQILVNNKDKFNISSGKCYNLQINTSEHLDSILTRTCPRVMLVSSAVVLVLDSDSINCGLGLDLALINVVLNPTLVFFFLLIRASHLKRQSLKRVDMVKVSSFLLAAASASSLE